ncbi:restriction endonuclease [Candidatus Pseudothioglobus singularis]|nr:restriction endonuclease [Candidatus Pseudothioglobus singularis]
MSLPTYQDYYPYILKNGDIEKTADQYLELIMTEMDVPKSEQEIKNQSGEPTVRNRLRWGIHYLKKAGLMDKPSRGKFVITSRGKAIRQKLGENVNNKTLEEFEEFLDFKNKVKSYAESSDTNPESNEEELTPVEKIENASQILKQELKVDLNNQIMEMSPYFFEKLVVDLLKKMGYGSFDGTTVTKKSSDGGIDGVVYQDELGLDIVYVQAKRYKEENKIGSPDLQKFCGALSGKQASKGIFFTTSDFTKEALEYLKTTPQKIIPVNGNKLLDLMIDFGVGAETSASYETYRIDEDYFSE